MCLNFAYNLFKAGSNSSSQKMSGIEQTFLWEETIVNSLYCKRALIKTEILIGSPQRDGWSSTCDTKTWWAQTHSVCAHIVYNLTEGTETQEQELHVSAMEVAGKWGEAGTWQEGLGEQHMHCTLWGASGPMGQRTRQGLGRGKFQTTVITNPRRTLVKVRGTNDADQKVCREEASREYTLKHPQAQWGDFISGVVLKWMSSLEGAVMWRGNFLTSREASNPLCLN